MGLFTKKIFKLIDARDTDALDALFEEKSDQLEAKKSFDYHGNISQALNHLTQASTLCKLISFLIKV